MISLDTAQRLRDVGVRWEPEAGDRFAITDPRMDDEVYVVSNMTIDVHRFASGTVLGFNGTTEWALDSIEQQRALWLPREGQLRALLGTTFRRLERTVLERTVLEPTVLEPAEHPQPRVHPERTVDEAWRLDLVINGEDVHLTDPDPEQVYARGLLVLITGTDESG